MRKLGVIALAGVVCLAGCATTDYLGELRTSIAAGVECPELFAIFDQIAEDSDEFSDAQGEIINVGCHMRDSERNDEEAASAASDSPWLGVPGETVSPSTACEDAAIAAASEPDSTKAESLIAATLDVCASVDEWMSVLELHPGVMGMIDGYIPQILDLQSVCYSYVETAVCQDALARGLSVGP